MATLLIPALSVQSISTSGNRHGLRSPKGGCVVAGRFYRGGCFCRPYDETNVHEKATVEIKGASYVIEPVDPGSTYSAVRLTKRVSGESYTVARDHEGRVTCQCPGFHYRGECRHVEANLLPVAPIVERVREIVPTPTPAHEKTPTPFVAELIVHNQEETVRSIALPLVERHNAIHESGPAGPGMLEMVALRAWERMDAEDRESFTEWSASIGSGLDWCDFVVALRDGVAVEFGPDDYRPEPEPFAPTVEDEAEWAGILEGEELREYEAFLDSLARDREEEAFGYGIRETDLYRVGACS